MEANKWVAIKGFEGFYEININGEVRSLERNVLHNNRFRKIVSKQIETRIDRAGYLTVRLSKDGKSYTKSIHRLIANAFISNPNALPIVNHIDGNKLNNSIDNLEWVIHSENIKHAYNNGLIAKYKGCIKVIDTCTNFIYNSVKEAAQSLGIPYSTCKNYLNGNRKNPTCLRIAA